MIAVLFELNTWHHLIHLAANHPADLEPTWFGHSIGRWDGDTLVVDTHRLQWLHPAGHDRTPAQRGVARHPDVQAHRRRAHRLHRHDRRSQTYTKRWKNERVLTLLKTPLLEYSCEENNKSLWDGRIKAWTPPWAKEKK